MRNKSKSLGFTLIEMAVVIAITSVLGVTAMQVAKVETKKRKRDTTEEHLKQITNALSTYYQNYNHLPCPASRVAPVAANEFGQAENTIIDTTATPPTITADCAEGVPTAGTISVLGTGGKEVRIGTVPFSILGLGSENALDGWGNRILYAVSEELADSDYPWDLKRGAITVMEGGVPKGPLPGQTPFILVSFGPNGGGAFTAGGVEHNTCSPANTGTQAVENCDNDATFVTAKYSEARTPADRFENIIAASLKENDLQLNCGNVGKLYGPDHGATTTPFGCVSGFKIGNLEDAAPNTGLGTNDEFVGIGTETPVSRLDVYSDSPTNNASWLSIRTPGTSVQQQSVIGLTTKDDDRILGSAYIPATPTTPEKFNLGWAIYGRGNQYASPGETANRFGISYWNGSVWHNDIFSALPNSMNYVGIGTFSPTAQLHVHNNGRDSNSGDPATTVAERSGIDNILNSAYMPADGTQDYLSYTLSNSATGYTWRNYLGDPDSGYGVRPNAYEVWEYPAGATNATDPSDPNYCCRRRFAIESSSGLTSVPVQNQLVLTGDGNIGIRTPTPSSPLTVAGRMEFFGTGNGNNDTDVYTLEKIQTAADANSLRLTINDNFGESFQIWGNACNTVGGCTGAGMELMRVEATINADGVTPNSLLKVNGRTVTEELKISTHAVQNTACNAIGEIATDNKGIVLTCQYEDPDDTTSPLVWLDQSRGTEETESIVGCHGDDPGTVLVEGNEFCTNLNGAPANTTLFSDPSPPGTGNNGWRARIGPRSFCALGFIAQTAAGDGTTFCRVLPTKTAPLIDPATGKLIWEIRIGMGIGTKKSIACHAVCIK